MVDVDVLLPDGPGPDVAGCGCAFGPDADVDEPRRSRSLIAVLNMAVALLI